MIGNTVMWKKSLRTNMYLNVIKEVIRILFPLITFRYVSVILGVENIGKYNFSNSFISFFILLSGLGINTYATREGARIRNDYNRLSCFCGEVFTINIYSTLVSYALLIISFFFSTKIHNYQLILLILSLQIFLKTIGVDWIYSIYEDYAYITVRTILFQVISLVFLFVFVKTESDLYKYAIISVLSTAGASLLNFFCSKKYCHIKLVWKCNLKKHLKPMLILFAMVATVTIYVSADMIMLGLMCDDRTVGIYSVSTKIYSTVKTIISAALVVSIPRLSSLLGENAKKKFEITAERVFYYLLTMIFPIIIGMIVLREQIIILLASSDFIDATISLIILSISLFFCMGAWFWGQCVLIPTKREKDLFKITVVSALLNVMLNILLIPVWKEKAAAITTVIAEAFSFTFCWIKGSNYVKLNEIKPLVIKILIGCFGIGLYAFILRSMLIDRSVFFLLFFLGSIFLYFAIEYLIGNQVVKEMSYRVLERIGVK